MTYNLLTCQAKIYFFYKPRIYSTYLNTFDLHSVIMQLKNVWNVMELKKVLSYSLKVEKLLI